MHRVRSLLFADDVVLIDDAEECLQRMVNEMGVVCGWGRRVVLVKKSRYESVLI